MSGDILTVKTVKRVRSVRGSALVHIMMYDKTLITSNMPLPIKSASYVDNVQVELRGTHAVCIIEMKRPTSPGP